MREGSPVLTIRDLSIALPPGSERALAVENVDLEVESGRTLCIVGESGSGKSMIAKAIMGLLPVPKIVPAGGSIVFEGRDLLSASESELQALRGSRMGMIFQEPMTSLNPIMPIGEQIGEVLDAHANLSRAERHARVVAALADVGLPEPEKIVSSYPFRLSGGQRQRVMIAAAMVLEPALLIADEPTTALDVTTQAQILRLMKSLQSRKGTAMVFITHDFGVVAQMADQVAVIQLGKVVEKGDVADVLRQPRHQYTRTLIEAIPRGTPGRPATERHGKPVVEIASLRKSFGRRPLFGGKQPKAVIDDVSLTIRRGETLGLVGESGSGKSTIGRCITGLSRSYDGRILFDGQVLAPDIRSRPTGLRHRIQMVFQDPYASLNPRHTIGQAISDGPMRRGKTSREARRHAEMLLERVGLPRGAFDRYPHEFSGGQRQRVAIARALALEPDVLVADEPVSALDVSLQAQILGLFKEIKQSFDLSMLFITHDLWVAGSMCDRIAVLKQGKVVEIGDAGDIINAPRDRYTRELISSAPSFHFGRVLEDSPA